MNYNTRNGCSYPKPETDTHSQVRTEFVAGALQRLLEKSPKIPLYARHSISSNKCIDQTQSIQLSVALAIRFHSFPMMRLRLAHARWCLGLILMIVTNMHISLWIHRVYEKNSSKDFHPLYSDFANQFAMKRANYSRESYLQSTRLLELEKIESDSSVTESLPEYVGFPMSLHKEANFSSNNSEPVVVPTSLNNLAQASASDAVVMTVHKANRRKIPPTDYILPRKALPAFASDESEYILSSIIERSSSSANLHLTTFMLCHYALEPAVSIQNVHKVHPVMRETWRRAVAKFQTTQYHPSGARVQEADEEIFRCRIRHSSESEPYTVMGMFMPNRLTADPSANRLLDILRCPLVESQAAYRSYANINESIYTEIIRGNATIAAFTVPWKSRQTGFLQSHSKAASAVDAWRGHESIMEDRSSEAKEIVNGIDKLHICIPCSSKEPTLSTLPMYLEFVSHHLLLGASHINLPLPFGWNSNSMNRFTDIFQSYIEEGTISKCRTVIPTNQI